MFKNIEGVIVINSSEYLLNKDIKSMNVRIVGGELMSREEALMLATNANVDLIEISKNKDVSICVIESYDKFLYNKKKSERSHKNVQKNGLKEMKLGLCTGDHDLLHKANKTSDFIKEGYKVKISIALKGREISRNKEAIGMIDKFVNLCNVAYDKKPKLEGSTVFAIVTKQK